MGTAADLARGKAVGNGALVVTHQVPDIGAGATDRGRTPGIGQRGAGPVIGDKAADIGAARDADAYGADVTDGSVVVADQPGDIAGLDDVEVADRVAQSGKNALVGR